MTVAASLIAGPARRRVTAVLVAAATIGIVVFALTAPAARLDVTSFSGEGTTGRSDLWGLAAEMAGNHPIQGIGLENFTVRAPAYLTGETDVERVDLVLDGTQVHNTYLNVLTELGVVGLLLFVCLVGGVLLLALAALPRLAASGAARDELLARGVVVGAIGMLAAYVFFSAQFEKPFWIVLGMLVALPGLAAVRRRSDAVVEAAPTWRLPSSRS
jgi:exopolysaccharide production protein ExoQ